MKAARFKSPILMAAFIAAGWASTSSAQIEDPRQAAQEQTQPPPAAAETAAQDSAPANPATAAAAPLEQKKVEQFADALLAVQTIQTQAAQQLQTTSDPAEADKVKSTAQSDMIAAVERSGLKVEEFNQIAANLSADVDLRSRVAAEMEKRGGGS